MKINEREFHSKVLGCWMGKNIGGTLGAPMEWKRGLLDLDFYAQKLDGEPLPNDDLDIQLLWLVALEEKGIALDAHTLAEYWTLYVTPHWSEYGTAKVNMRAGLMPPLCGDVDNPYKHSCGAFIRSEIWACIAPGAPEVAARYAYQDAMLDHGARGEGTYAEVFCAAMESAAFVEHDFRKLIEIGLSFIPVESGVAGAVRLAIASYDGGETWQQARDTMLEKFRGDTFMGWHHHTSEEDHKKGFTDGVRGWDAPSNVGILVIGLLYGEGDFSKTICTAVNCGEDTDCTGATAGALFGIIYGIEAIPEKWIAPIGRGIKVGCLNFGELGYYGDQLPQNVDELTARTVEVAKTATRAHNLPLQLTDGETDLIEYSIDRFFAGGNLQTLYANGPVYKFDFFEVEVDYGEGAWAKNGEEKTVKLQIRNTYKAQAVLNLQVYAPDGWQVAPSKGGVVMSLPSHLSGPVNVEFRLRCEQIEKPLSRFVVEITSEGRQLAMLIPIVLQNRNWRPTVEAKIKTNEAA